MKLRYMTQCGCFLFESCRGRFIIAYAAMINIMYVNTKHVSVWDPIKHLQ